MKIAGQLIDSDSPPFVIAELGHNHQGDVETCIKMIEAAALAGASAVKLQKRSNSILYTPAAYNNPYQSENAFGATYGEHRDFLEFDRDSYIRCIKAAEHHNIVFFATAFDIQSADFLNALDVPAFKIASGDLKSIPLIKHITKLNKPVILSTGGGAIEDVDRAVAVLDQSDCEYSLLQCTAAYPPDFNELNLKVIKTYIERYPRAIIGYSGHDSGISMSLVAYILGARVIEKHFTLNRAMKGTDHAFSLEPTGLRKLVRDLDRARAAMGDGIKRQYKSEEAPILKMGKSLYAARDIQAGETIQLTDIEMRSPVGGLLPIFFDQLVGRKISRTLKKYEAFLDSDLT